MTRPKSLSVPLVFSLFLLSGVLMGTALGETPAPLPEAKLVHKVDGKYARGACFDLDSSVAEKELMEIANNFMKQVGVEWVEIGFYLKGKKKGDGVFAAALFDDAGKDIIFIPTKFPEGTSDVKRYILTPINMEKMLAYKTTADHLIRAYKDNEVVADDMYKGQRVGFEEKVASVSKDGFGNAFLSFEGKENPFQNVICYVDPKDPVLRKIKKGSEVTATGQVRGLIVQDVVLEDCVFFPME